MRVSAVDHALPRDVVRSLRSQIIETPRPDAGTYWYALDARPRLVFEHVIQHLRPLAGGDFIGAEWWFRATTTDTGFPFHFDRDEGIRRRVVSPDLASILYLSDAGGPTIIVDATPARTAAPRAAIAVPPRAGRFAMFPGALLHGVLPGAPGRWPRVTMLVNWWRSEPRQERARPLRGGALAATRWRAPRTRTVALERIDPARLLARAAWCELISKQASYR